MCIVKPDQSLVSRTMQYQRILDSVLPFWSWLNPLDIDLYPVARFVDHVRITIESQESFKTVVFLLVQMAHYP